MQALIYACALLFLALILFFVHSWASYDRQERVRERSRQRVAATREQEHRDLEVEHRHQREMMKLWAVDHVKLLRKAIKRSGGDPMMTSLLEEALIQEVDILRWMGGDRDEIELTGETLGVSPAFLLPILQRLESIVRSRGDAAVECAGFEAWSGLFVVSPRGKLAQALERLLAHLASVPGKIEMRAEVEGRFAVLTLRSSAIRPDLYANLATAMARNWIAASWGEVVVQDDAYRITLSFDSVDERGGTPRRAGAPAS